jgi:two-component system LytT family sensor kinase
MINPILSSGKNFLWYSGTWASLWLVQVLVFTQTQQYSWAYAAADAFIFHFLFFVLGIGIWYLIKGHGIQDSETIPLLIRHIIIASVLVFLWYLAGKNLILLLPLSADNQDIINQEEIWRIIYGYFLYGMLSLSFLLIHYNLRLKERIKRENELESLAREAEFNLLKAQTNPHFLFNSLNSIHALCLTRPQEASEMILELADFFRFSLKQNAMDNLRLSDEIDNIQRYLSIEKIRFGPKLNFDFSFETDCLDSMVPSMVLQPLYENAVKHGLYSGVEQLQISTTGTMRNNALELSIQNNLGGKRAQSVGNHSGLENIRKRLHHQFGSGQLLTTTFTEESFHVQLTLPQPTITPNKSLNKNL